MHIHPEDGNNTVRQNIEKSTRFIAENLGKLKLYT
jgi:hypothetical protein